MSWTLIGSVCINIMVHASTLVQNSIVANEMTHEVQAVVATADGSKLGIVLRAMASSCVDRFPLDLSDELKASGRSRTTALQTLSSSSANRHREALEEAFNRTVDERELRRIGVLLDGIRGGGAPPSADGMGHWTLKGSKEELLRFRSDLEKSSYLVRHAERIADLSAPFTMTP